MANSLELISEIVSRCDDIGFRDFDRGVYLNAIYRANRLVARKYHLFRKMLTLTAGQQGDLSKDMILDIPDMKEPFLVNVNDINLNKKDHQILPTSESYSYYMFRQPDGTYLFNYILGSIIQDEILIQAPHITEEMSQRTVFDTTVDINELGKSATDTITILYEAIPERDYEESEFIIPPNYEEEQIELSVYHLCKLGIAKFKEEKLDKYSRLYRLYKRSSDFDKEVVETSGPLRLQVFQYP